MRLTDTLANNKKDSVHMKERMLVKIFPSFNNQHWRSIVSLMLLLMLFKTSETCNGLNSCLNYGVPEEMRDICEEVL